MSKLFITDTILRDAHQSLIATRMTLDDMLPLMENAHGRDAPRLRDSGQHGILVS